MRQPEMRVCKRCGMEKPITNYNKKRYQQVEDNLQTV